MQFTHGGVLRALSGKNRVAALLALLSVAGMGCAAGQRPIDAVDIRASSPLVATPTCAADQLDVNLSGPSGAAGSSYYTISFTNRSARPCVLEGFSSVRFGESPTGPETGRPGARQPGEVGVVTLAGTRSALEVVRVVNPAVFPGAACSVSPVEGIAVYPPGQAAATWLPLVSQTCRAGPQTLFVWPVEPSA